MMQVASLEIFMLLLSGHVMVWRTLPLFLSVRIRLRTGCC